jgi:hypothetical protein
MFSNIVSAQMIATDQQDMTRENFMRPWDYVEVSQNEEVIIPIAEVTPDNLLQ